MAFTRVIFQMFIVLFVVSPTLALVTSGCHNLWVQLVRWSGNGNDQWSDDCDYWPANKDCDPYFYICVDHKTPSRNYWSGTRMGSCYYSGGVQRTQEYENRNGVNFGTGSNALRSGLSNPLKYNTITRPWQQGRLYIKIEDGDDIGDDDPIDEHMFDLNGLNLDNTGNVWAYPHSSSAVSHNWIPKETTGTYYSKTNSRMTIKYKAICCQDYYNFDCSVFCVAQDSDSQGHYTCDPMRGDKVCRAGFVDPYTDPPCATKINPCSSHTGELCESPCENNPCQNGGTCNPLSSGYECECSALFFGQHCESVMPIGCRQTECPPPATLTGESDSDGLPLYAYIIIAVVGLLLLVIVVVVLLCRRNRRKASDDSTEMTNAANETHALGSGGYDVPPNRNEVGIFTVVAKADSQESRVENVYEEPQCPRNRAPPAPLNKLQYDGAGDEHQYEKTRPPAYEATEPPPYESPYPIKKA